MTIITDPLFYLVAIPAVVCLGLSKGGFTGIGMVATPLLALIMPPLEAAALLLPILLGALWVHAGNGWMFASPNGGWEYPLFLIAVLLVAAESAGLGPWIGVGQAVASGAQGATAQAPAPAAGSATTIAVIGDNAVRRFAAGGNAAGVKTFHETTALEGILARAKAGEDFAELAKFCDAFE